MEELFREDMLKVYFTQEELRKKVEELGDILTEEYKGRDVVFIGVLKGSCVFMSDLVRNYRGHCSLDFVAASSYGNGTVTTGSVNITKDLSMDIRGKDVIIVEDILDTGVTLSCLKRYFESKNPASVKIVTLLDKPARRTADIKADYCGFSIPDEFVVGYGLDFAEKYRNLPYIGVLKPEKYM